MNHQKTYFIVNTSYFHCVIHRTGGVSCACLCQYLWIYAVIAAVTLGLTPFSRLTATDLLQHGRRCCPPCSRPPKRRRSCPCLEAVPVAQWNVHLGKDQSRSHPPAACSLHQGEGSPRSVLVLAGQGSLLHLPRAEARMSFKHLERQLKKKGCEDHRFTSCPLKVRVSGGFTPLWI